MNKNAIRGYVVLVMLLAVFCVVAFAIPFAHTRVFWLGFGFGIFAIMFQLYIFKISFADKDVKSRFYGFPIARIGVYYLALQLIVSLIEMALASVLPIAVPVVVNVLLLAIVLVGCITADAMRDEINRQDEQLEKDVSNMRELQSLSRTLVSQCPEGELKTMTENLADNFRYSDPVSSEKTMEIEKDMKQLLGDIQQAIVEGDIDGAKEMCGKLKGSLAERNRVCSVSK